MSATTLSHSILRQLIESGVQDFVLSPGSRNAPLSIALNEAAEKGLINLHVKIDERGAGFFALGISQASRKYVALICTSGTAAANYHPAALEAYHANVDLIFITADRPERLRRTGANQTTLQNGLLAPLATHDISTTFDCKKILTSGPIHLNLQFDEPLLPAEPTDWLSGVHADEKIEKSAQSTVLSLPSRSVIVIGHDAGGFDKALVDSIVTGTGLPVIAEDPLSCAAAIPHAAIFLADSEIREKLAPEVVVVIGRTTLSRSINSFIAAAPKVVVIDPRIEQIDTRREADEIFFELPKFSVSIDQVWSDLWSAAGSASEAALELSWSEQLFLREFARLIPRDSALFIGSSRPARDIEACAKPRNGIHIFANRGLAGIDGNISTAFGISTQFAQTFSVMGDLTFLHDLSALANVSAHQHTIFIIDNNGGGIFSTLPQAGVDGFEKVFGTPHNLNLESIIAGFGYSVEKIKSLSDLEPSMRHKGLHFVIVEVPARDENALSLKKLHQRVASAVRIGNNLA